MLDEVEFSVFNKTTGERVPAQFKNGLLNFLAIKGNIYSVSVEDNNHQVQSQDVTIADNAGADENIDLNFDNKGDAATDQVQRLVPVNKRIRTADGNMLDEVTVTVFDKATGERVYSKFENGLLKFAGISGNIYAVSIEDKNHNIQSQDIAIPADATAEQNADLILGDQDNTMANEDEGKRIPVVGEIMVAQGNMLDEVEVTVSDKATGERIPSQFKNGLLSFIGVKGNIYSVAVQEGNQPARIEEVVIQENAVNAQRVSIPFDDATNTLANTGAATTLGSNDQQVAVTGRLSDEDGMISDENTVSVTDKETGATVPSEFKNGVLDFTAEKGNVYTITTEDKNHQVRSQDVTIPNDASTSQEISLAMNESPATIPMSLNVFKSDDKTPLAGANVTITTFDGKQIERTSDENGNVTFSLPENSPYTVFVNKDGYTGMQSGIVQNGSADSTQPLQISTQKRESDVVPVAAQLTGIDENALREQDIVVTSQSTGEVIPAQLNDGILNFYGKQGETYSITAADGNESLESKEITIPGNATEAYSTIALSDKGNSIGISGDGSNAIASTLIRLNNDGAGDKFYISTGNSNAEITERNGMLYLNDGTGERNLGEGTLASLQNDPSYLKQLGLSFDEIIDIQNIYFDNNKATLDDTDKKELDKARIVLQRYPHLQLTISAHADDRGTNKYNLNLSKRRAKAVAVVPCKDRRE